MGSLRWCFSFLTLMSLSCGLVSGGSDRDLRHLESNSTAIRYESGSRSSESIELRNLDMLNNDMNLFTAQLFKDSKQLSSIDLSNSKIIILPAGIFSNQKNLTSINLSNNQIEVLLDGIFSNQINLNSLDLSNNKIRVLPDGIFSNQTNLKLLNLSKNHITTISSSAFENFGSPEYSIVLLSHNNIDDLSFIQSLPKNLQSLELHNNKLRKIDTSILNYFKHYENLINLTLHDNLWECTCELREYFRGLSKKLPNLNNIPCREMKQPTSSKSSEEFCTDYGLISVWIGIVLLGIIIRCLVAMYYRYQQVIKIWLYARQWCLWWISEDELDKDKIYNAFISYSHQDDDFVMNELVTKLEEGSEPFKLCVLFRDWLPGEYIADQVVRSVENSKRTVIVLSANFTQCYWAKVEFHAAHSQALNDGRKRVIVIIYGEILLLDDLDSELRAYLLTNGYIKWGDPCFWQKLRYALSN